MNILNLNIWKLLTTAIHILILDIHINGLQMSNVFAMRHWIQITHTVHHLAHVIHHPRETSVSIHAILVTIKEPLHLEALTRAVMISHTIRKLQSK